MLKCCQICAVNAKKKNIITNGRGTSRGTGMSIKVVVKVTENGGGRMVVTTGVMDVVSSAIYDKIARDQCAEGVFSVERVTIGWKIVRHERIAFANNVVKKGIVQVFTQSAGVANATMNTRV